MAKSDSFQERLIRDLAELKTEVRLGNLKIETMDHRINGRLKKLEKTVFGDEEVGLIGLAEGARVESREIKSLNKRWTMIVAVSVFLAQNAATWAARKLGWGEHIQILETVEAAGVLHSENQGK